MLLAASLAVSMCATPVFAAGGATGTTPNMGSKEGATNATVGTATDTKLLYKVTKGYTWTIPATIDFGENAGVNNTSTVEANLAGTDTGKKAEKESAGTTWKGSAPKVCVTKNVIGTGESLHIELKAKNGTNFEVKNEENTALTYSVRTGTAKQEGTTTTTYTNQPVLAAGSDIFALSAGQNEGEVELVFVLSTATSTAEIAGEYEGFVTFTARIDTET